jgi:hypothetical protein
MTVEDAANVEETKTIRPEKDDVISVDATKSVETTSDDGNEQVVSKGVKQNSTGGSSRQIGRIGRLGFIAIVIGLAVGLVLGLTRNKSDYLRKPAESEGEENDRTIRPLLSVTKPPMNNTKVPIEDKTQWLELVGLPGNQAKAILEDSYGDEYNVRLVNYGDSVTADFRTDRIFLFLDADGNVMRTPKVGR